MKITIPSAAQVITQFQAKYYAHELGRRFPSDSPEKLAGALVDAQVDLNPHQVEAALFAFRSPLSKGALLADEVGLGKTIEAGLVLSQKWAERNRRILIITPSNLRKQWHQELHEKFFLPCQILEAKPYNAAIKLGNFKPFEIKDKIVICSYQFACSKASDVNAIRWDLVVIDEAHRLRNVYKASNIVANTLKRALQEAPKLLLTATPLQNSLLELFGLVSFVDEQVFGDLKSFREQFSSLDEDGIFDVLKARLKPVCHRTLRRQVAGIISYTKRHPMVEDFTPDESEDRLYNLVSDYLRRDNLQALPNSQKSLMILVLRKLLASSTFAIAGALNTLIKRLKEKLVAQQPKPLEEELDEDYEALNETAEEWDDDQADVEPMSESDQSALKREITDLEVFYNLAVSVTHNAKGKALLTALDKAFATPNLPRKAIIFTESRRTQDYLQRLLLDSFYKDGIVLFNGSNSDPSSRKIYAEWMEQHEGTDKVTGSRTADMRSALVDYFRDKGQIMIATEAGSEGINLQFCALVVNYDLPWNPQRVEQRIGRCHRYGQKHDVVVVNFLNRKNEADQRVFQLLSEKFHLFEGVFGASDDVLGTIESGVDFEKRIAEIYQKCRTQDEIKSSFDQLQLELSVQINDSMSRTRQQLLENFDQEVHDKLRVHQETSEGNRTRYEKMLMDVTRYALDGRASFAANNNAAFELQDNPFPNTGDIPLGLYELPRRSGEAHLYRLGHPLAQEIIAQIKEQPALPTEVVFDYSNAKPRISALQPFKGKSGNLLLSVLTIEALGQAEDYLIFAAQADDGTTLEEDMARRMLSLAVQSTTSIDVIDAVPLRMVTEKHKAEIQKSISERNGKFFEEEAAKLDGWAEDLKITLERDIKDMDRQIREAKRAATLALTLEEKLAGQKQIKNLESQRSVKRRTLFDAQDEIDRKREVLIADIEGKLRQAMRSEEVFSLRWRLV